MKTKNLIKRFSPAFASVLLVAVIFCGCEERPKCKYKHVVKVEHEINKYEITVTEYSGGNAVQRGAGGAIIGGGVDLLLGGSGKGGAIVGGLVGAATTDDPKAETHKEIKTDINYTITFNDSTVQLFKNYCPYSVGDSVAKNNCY